MDYVSFNQATQRPHAEITCVKSMQSYRLKQIVRKLHNEAWLSLILRVYLRGSGRGRADLLFHFLFVVLLAFRSSSSCCSFGAFAFGVISGISLGFSTRRFSSLFSLALTPGDACRGVGKDPAKMNSTR